MLFPIFGKAKNETKSKTKKSRSDCGVKSSLPKNEIKIWSLFPNALLENFVTFILNSKPDRKTL